MDNRREKFKTLLKAYYNSLEIAMEETRAAMNVLNTPKEIEDLTALGNEIEGIYYGLEDNQRATIVELDKLINWKPRRKVKELQEEMIAINKQKPSEEALEELYELFKGIKEK